MATAVSVTSTQIIRVRPRSRRNAVPPPSCGLLTASNASEASAARGARGGAARGSSGSLTSRRNVLSLIAGGGVAGVGLPLPAEGEQVGTSPAGEGEAAASPSPPKFTFEVEEVKKGDGSAPPAKGDLVVVEYVAKYASSGEVYDSTRARKKPIAFVYGGRPFAGVTRGLMLGLEGMTPGQRRVVRVPAELGFGREGTVLVQASCDGPFCDKSLKDLPPTKVPPDADLVYEVELVKVVRNIPLTMQR